MPDLKIFRRKNFGKEKINLNYSDYHYDCRFFNGYKPCRFKRPCPSCPHYNQVKTRICIVSLEALGSVLRSTVLLEPIKRKYPDSHVTWVTLKGSKSLLENNPNIDRLIIVEATSNHVLEFLKFDVLFGVDKSLEAGALAQKIDAKNKFGFGLDPYSAAIIPLNPEAAYQYRVGLDDQLKFFENTKPETQQLTESMGLRWKRDEYSLTLKQEEKVEANRRRKTLLESKQVRGVIGYNTGCSLLFPYKKFRVERAIEVVRAWRKKFPEFAVALLGGHEDTQRQAEIKAAFNKDPSVIDTPTDQGLRSGILWMDACDIVFSGCSLGMHMAIALKKPVIAWFGVSCPQEVDLYDRGEKLIADVNCSPCWKKSCQNEPKCFDMVSEERIMAATEKTILQNFSKS